MGFLKFVIPFVGGALTAAAVGLTVKKNHEEKENNAEMGEIDAEFEEADDENTVDVEQPRN